MNRHSGDPQTQLGTRPPDAGHVPHAFPKGRWPVKAQLGLRMLTLVAASAT